MQELISIRNYLKKCVCFAPVVLYLVLSLYTFELDAQVSLTNAAPALTIDFSNGMQTGVGSNPSTAFTAAGFEPNPVTAGRLNSNAWAITGWSDGDLAFGATKTTGDYARGTTTTAVTTGGIYAYTGAPQTAPNPALMIQPGTSDFASGTITLKIQNNGTSIINQLIVSYNIYIRNDQGRSSSLLFSYSTDNINYTSIPALDYTTPVTADANGWIVVPGGPSRFTNITGLSVAPTNFIYIRWTSDDVAGSGSRDEIGLDDINLQANFTSACTPPTTNATLNSFSTVLSSQFTVNFTRGNGTGGLLIAVSPAVLSQNPISGITYSSNSNYGSGAALGNGFVVYNSNAVANFAAGSVTVTGLSPGITYTVSLFEYAVTVPCYITTAVASTQMTGATSVTQPTDLFRSRATGDWANVNTWESSSNGGASWVNADLSPTSSSAGINIQAGHTVDIKNPVTIDQVTISGTVTLSNGGKINLSDGPGYDIDIFSGGVLKIQTSANYSTSFIPAASYTMNVATGGKITVGNGGSSPGYSAFGYNFEVNWNNSAIFEWNTTDPFATAFTTYFPGVAAGIIPIFRVSKTPSLLPGASSTTAWYGLLEVNSNLTLRGSGTKIFRYGISGTANLNQDDDCGQFIIGYGIGTASLSGTGALNLNISGAIINASNTVTLNSDKSVNQTNGSGTLTVISNANLYCQAYVISGSAIFTLQSSGTLGIGSALGISSSGATGNIQTTGLRTFDAGATYLYNGIINQVTGNGLPGTITGYLTINNSGPAGNRTVTLTTNNTTVNNITLSGGLFAAGTGQQLNISSGGLVSGGGGDFETGAAAGIVNFTGNGFCFGTLNPYNVYASGQVSFNNTTIQPGGSFRINTGGSAAFNAPYYADGSTLAYNTGSSFTVSNEWKTNTTGYAMGVPSNVTIMSGTTVTFGSVTTAFTMRGDMLISNGATFSLSTNQGGDLNIGGNWTRGATGNYTLDFQTSGRLITFNGSGSQTITRTGGGTETFTFITVNKAAGSSLVLAGSPNATNLSLTGYSAPGTPAGILFLLNGNIDLNQQTLNYTIGNIINFNIQVDGTTGNLTRNITSTGGQGVFAIVNSYTIAKTLAVTRASTASDRRAVFNIGSTVKLTIGGTTQNMNVNFGLDVTSMTNIDGILQLDNQYGFVTTNAPTYGTGSALVYNTGSFNYNRGLEWSAVSGAGYPYNVTVQNNCNVLLNAPNPNGSADRAIAGTLTITSGASINAGNSANKLTIGGNLALDGFLFMPSLSGGDLYIAGNWNRSSTGTFSIGSTNVVYFNGSGNSTITAYGGESFNNMTIIKNAGSNTVSLLDSIYINKNLTITTGTLDLANRNVYIYPTSSGATATIDKFGASGSVVYNGTGRFIIYQYIAVATGSFPNHTKSWQFLAVPVTDNVPQTINEAWQEGRPPLVAGTAHYGTIITNPTAGTGGFDIVGGGASSMRTYVPGSGTGSWAGISGTYIAHYNQKGYMIFVRGDRTVTTTGGTPTYTYLRTRGKIFEPNNTPPVINIGADQFESIGNPYVSAIDFSNDAGVIKSANVQKVFYVWDPRKPGAFGFGAYQTLIKGAGTDYTVFPGGGSYGTAGSVVNTIESGQAFFVRTVGGAGTISFNENAKTASTRLFTKPAPQAEQSSQLSNMLYIVSGGSEVMVDGALCQFGHYSNSVDMLDAVKMVNEGENLGILNSGQVLTVERRAHIQATDTIQYYLNSLRQLPYMFEFTPQQISKPGLHAWLEDKFLHTMTNISLSDTTRVYFTVTNEPSSYLSDRFRLVFVKKCEPVDDLVPGPITKAEKIQIDAELRTNILPGIDH